MFALVVMLADMDRNGAGFGIQRNGAKGQPGDVFENVGVLDSFSGALAPGKGGMAGDEDTGDGERVESLGTETTDDDRAGVADIGLRRLLRRSRAR